jgi:hypothetical protein
MFDEAGDDPEAVPVRSDGYQPLAMGVVRTFLFSP